MGTGFLNTSFGRRYVFEPVLKQVSLPNIELVPTYDGADGSISRFVNQTHLERGTDVENFTR